MRLPVKALLFFLLLLLPAAASAAEKPYWRSDLFEGARRLEAQVKRDTAARPKPVADLRREVDAAIAAKDAKAAAQRLGELAAQANDAPTWLRLGRTLLTVPTANAGEKNQFMDRAAAAAFIAYRRASARNDEGDALALIGRVYAERQIWRAALDTLKLALERRATPELQAFYDRVREEHGFRLLDYTVDADVASPRLCLQFSEPLSKRADFSPFVTVAGMERPAVSAADQQLCVEGLKHGERYELTLRVGVPSATGETLRRQSDIVAYVRDRKPAVRFTGRAYVLPRTGQKGLPLTSVNTRRVAVEVLKIGDRGLLPSAIEGQFRQNIESYQLESLTEQKATRVYQGEMDVEQDLNKEVVTAFPVDEALPNLAPGVYALIARVADGPRDPDAGARATQWFIVSDLGITAVSTDNGLSVLVRALGTAQPVADAEVRLVAKSNEVLATKRTDANGYATFEAGLVKGTGASAPAVVIAEVKPNDYAFLSLADNPFDLSDRGVRGRIAPGAVDAQLFTERGVYRTGETVHLTALVRDAEARALNVPLTLILLRPDGVEDRRASLATGAVGGYSLDLPVISGAQTGTWRVRAYTDPKRPPVGEASFLVEDYVPDRIEFELKSAATEFPRGRPIEINLEGRYLFGPPAANLDLDGEIEVRLARRRAGFDNYVFGLADDDFTAVRRPLADLPKSDAQGRAKLNVEVPVVTAPTRPLEAEVTVRMAEAGGRAIERRLALPVAATAPMIGVRPLFRDRVGEGEAASFEVALVAPDGKLIAQPGLKWQLYRIETRYQWYKSGGTWDFEPVKSTRKVADGTLDAIAGGPARISSPVQYGRYRLEVASGEADGPATSYVFDAGWSGEATADTPDRLEVTLDKPEYAPGDTLTVNFAPRGGGTATVMVVGDKVHASALVPLTAGAGRASFRVEEGWGPGAYVVAFHHRPLDVSQSRMPGRAVGLAWFGVGRVARTLSVKLEPPAQIRPRTSLAIPVTIAGLSPGEEARVIVAAVDVGILNLTNYKPPAPEDYFLGQRRLSGEVRDLYGALIDGMQGVRGKLRSGGDVAGMSMSGNPPSQPPLALYSGIVTVDAQGRATVNFDIPAFDGTARVMAVAWSGTKLGHATTDVLIRDPVVLTTTLPRFLAAGDRSTLRVDVDNVEGPAGEYAIELIGDGAVDIQAPAQRVNLAAKARHSVTVPVTGKGTGRADVAVRVTGPNALTVERTYLLNTRPAYPPIERRTVSTLAKGQSLVVGAEVLADVVAGTGAVSLSVTPPLSIDVPALLLSLDRYPYGCSEQIASRALPMLYLSELAAESSLGLDASGEQRIKDAIQRVLARQSSEGAIGLWSAGGQDNWLHAYVTDFLTRAKEKGFQVPDAAFRLALDRLRNSVNISERELNDGGATAYALYVLTRNSVAPLGDLRYLADAKLDALDTPLAKGHVAAALALLGDRTRAERVFNAALEAIPVQASAPEAGRNDYGSMLRDAAALATLASEAGMERIARAAIVRADAARALTPRLSTQEQTWLVLAARALMKEGENLSLEIDGQPHRGTFFRTLKAAELAGKQIRIVNNGDEPVRAVVAIQGSPAAPEPAAAKGFSVNRSYFTLDGKAANPATVAQNQRLVVVLKVAETEKVPARVVLADYLPAGFEIDNPRLVASGDTGGLAWLGETTETAYSEFRDNRFVAAFDRDDDSKDGITVAYTVRAVSPGRYAHPPAIVEDMYRPDRFARTAAGSVEVTAR
jgi:uncharacterized protein YfaS (alpha-2-macroglobulin family)